MALPIEQDAKLARRGNKEAFIRLIRACEQSMYRIASALLKSDSDCADAIQEAILKAYQSVSNLREPKYFKTWLLRILINECHKLLQLRNKVIPLPQAQEHSGQEAGYARIEVAEAVASLEDDLRMVVCLHYYDDLAIKDIAALLQIAEGTVKSRLHRAREKLASYMATGNGGGYYEQPRSR